MKVHACLLGNWVCLNDDPDCQIGENFKTPTDWYEENAEIYSPKTKQKANTYYELDYIKIVYKGKSYRINPIFIQITDF